MPIDPDQFRQAADLVTGFRRPLVITHTRPDGDAVGCLVGMRLILRSLGADPLAVLFDPPASRYDITCHPGEVPIWGRDVKEADLAGVDGVVVLDTCAYRQLAPLEAWLRSSSLTKVVIDHHRTRDALADCYLIDESASAASLIVVEWADAAGWRLGRDAVTALFVGIATDTGWFVHGNTDARTLAAAARCLEAGVDAAEIHRAVYQSDSVAKARLRAAATAGMELRCDGRLAVMTVTRSMLQGLAAAPTDTEDLVNEPLRIGSVAVSVLFVEQPDGITRVSLRSKRDIDVAAIAAGFGGGGHTNAAGAKITGPIDTVQPDVIGVMELAIRSCRSSDRSAT